MTNKKANKSKILTLILGLTMCIALMLGIVFASPTNTVYAEGETLTPYDEIFLNNEQLNNGWHLDESYVMKSGTPDTGYVAKYNNGVLTLNNYHGQTIGISRGMAGCYTINLIGENTLVSTQKCVFIDSSYEGRITITSQTGGTLTLTATSNDDVWAIGAGVSTGAENNDVVIEGNAKINITATTSGENKSAVGIFARNVTIKENASVDITAGTTNSNSSSDWTKGIFAHGKATINTTGNINIDVTKAGGDSAFSYGIYSGSTPDCTKVGNMTIKWKVNKYNSGYGSSILNGTFSDEDHAINVDNCFASYRYGTPRYVNVTNGTLVGPGVPESWNTAGGNFLAGDKITLNAQDLQVSETNTTSIPFDKWVSFASEVTITNPTSQTGAEVTVPNKDIKVIANYKAFTVQPVFERINATKGTVTFTLISSEFTPSTWPKIRLINDLVISKDSPTVTVTPDSGTTYKATLENNGTVYGTLPGEYVVEVVYNNKTLYSEPFTVDYTEKKATIDSVTISGEQGEPIANTDITVTLTGYTFATTLSSDWITNLPSGLVQSVRRISDTKAKITVSGTPTALSDQVVVITIPKANITGLASDLTAESNSDAKFNIVATLTEIAVPTAKTGLTYTNSEITGVDDGVGYTLTGNKGVVAGNYTAIAKLKSGYKWNDGTITDKEIPWSIGKRNPVVSDFNFYEPSNLTYDGNAKTATVSLIAHYGDETGYTVTVKYKKGGVIVAEVKDAGEYEVYIDTTATANFKSATDIHDASWKFTIAKAEQSAPSSSLFTTVAPTSAAAKDGKIIGVTSDMEYYDANVEKYVTCPDGEMTGLHTRQYAIRYKETDNYRASEDVVVTVPPSGVSSYNLNVTGGTGGGVFIQGTRVTITANAPTTGQKFTGWTIEGISGLDTTQTILTFNMPANTVNATANYEDIGYTITVNGGTTNKAKAIYGASVTITANAPTIGQRFTGWTIEGITGLDTTQTRLTFNMPANAVTATANYEDIEYTVTVNGGTATPEMAKYQAEITVTANTAPEGKVFDKWTCETAGVTIEFASATSSTTTFVMPAIDVEIKANFRNVDGKPSFEVKVNGGTGAGTYKEGDSVTITADEPAEGKEFKGWKDESGKIVSTAKSYTFKVTGAMAFTAVYEDMSSGGEITPPAKKDGLSGGQIAGIVIGSVLLAGIGGFAIFWFAVKKKTFADLGVALKKGFTAVGNFFKTLGAKIKALFTKKK